MILSAGLSTKDLTNLSFGRREVGIIIKNLDITSGEVTVNLNEKLLSKSKSSSDTFSHSDKVMESTVDSVGAKRPQKKQALVALSKYTSMFPEKVCQFRWLLHASFLYDFAFSIYLNFIVGS